MVKTVATIRMISQVTQRSKKTVTAMASATTRMDVSLTKAPTPQFLQVVLTQMETELQTIWMSL